MVVPVLCARHARRYSLGVNGAHRSTTQNPVISARKSTVWLLTCAALVIAFLAPLGLVIYLPIAHPAVLRPVSTAFTGAAWVAFFVYRIRVRAGSRRTG
jgi:hypothetical protein